MIGECDYYKVVGWKCLACRRVVATRTCWVEREVEYLGDRDRPGKVAKALSRKLNREMQNGDPTFSLDTVRRPRCLRRPSWSRYRGRSVGVIAMILIALLMFWLALVLRLDVTQKSGWVPVWAFVAGLIWVGGTVGVVALYRALRNMHSCKVEERANMPLVVCSSNCVQNEDDPRSVAVARYIAKHPGLSFGQTEHTHISADPD